MPSFLSGGIGTTSISAVVCCPAGVSISGSSSISTYAPPARPGAGVGSGVNAGDFAAWISLDYANHHQGTECDEARNRTLFSITNKFSNPVDGEWDGTLPDHGGLVRAVALVVSASTRCRRQQAGEAEEPDEGRHRGARLRKCATARARGRVSCFARAAPLQEDSRTRPWERFTLTPSLLLSLQERQ